MTNEQLRGVMRYYLDHFNKTGATISDATVHKDILSDSDGPPTSKDVYRGNVSWSLSAAGNGKPAWPGTWMDLSVSDLADKLLPVGNNAVTAGTTAPAWFKAVHGF
jgi:hypothetical protein